MNGSRYVRRRINPAWGVATVVPGGQFSTKNAKGTKRKFVFFAFFVEVIVGGVV